MDDIPDLDDMSDMVQKIKICKSKPVETATQEIKIDDDKTKSKKQLGEFGGMKKGFLFSGDGKTASPSSQKSQTKQDKNADRDLITVSSNDTPTRDPLVLTEVQEAMKNASAFADQKWLNDDLLQQVASNKKLAKQLEDPHISEAVTWMQKDPKGAMQHYKNDEEVRSFFKEFYGVLGSHFTNLSQEGAAASPTAKDSRMTADDEKAFNNIMSDPEIKEILLRPDVQTLIGLLRSNPEEAQQHLAKSDSRLRADVKKLVSAGVLSFQCA